MSDRRKLEVTIAGVTLSARWWESRSMDVEAAAAWKIVERQKARLAELTQ
jgi:hypothetical protein